MKSYFFKYLLQKDGWISNVRIDTDAAGKITSLKKNETANGAFVIEGFSLPGFQNAHSHAFQYAMAGLAEVHNVSHTSDDFWSWREAMYQLALQVSPEQIESIATMLYSEMVRHGYTNVAEFHYVHHQKNGQPYDNLAEMGSRMVAAAKTAGINITLVPIFYQKGGFGQAPNDRQRRFISTNIDDYLELLEASREVCKLYDGANLGVGIHSMRGVEPNDIAEIAKSGPQDLPFHIHVAEQLKEIEDALTYIGKRPVEWMLDHIDMTDRFHLVHATHLTDEETTGIAKSGAHVVICPTTEGNLGDGLFPLKKFQLHGGKWSIGTDSHIGLNPLEELRMLDYGQRLTSHQRNTYTSQLQGDSGLFALNMMTFAGRKAMNDASDEFFQVGQALNCAIVDASAPLLASTSMEKMTSSIVYTADASHHWGTIVNGELNAKEGKHHRQEEIRTSFAKTMKTLSNR